MKTAWLLILILAVVPQAFAASVPREGRTDARVQTIVYNPRDVYQVTGHYGYSSHIVFAEGEEVIHVSSGDSLAWLTHPTGNILFLKPIEDNANTNMAVLTNKRIYNFELKASPYRSNSQTFALHFVYPEDEFKAQLSQQLESERAAAQEVVPQRRVDAGNLNFEYLRKGNEIIAPIRVFDDGEFTYFQFPPEIDVPAIFLLGNDGQETLINYHVKGQYVVVQKIGPQWVLRDGKNVACVKNDTYRARVQPSELSEAPKDTLVPSAKK